MRVHGRQKHAGIPPILRLSSDKEVSLGLGRREAGGGGRGSGGGGGGGVDVIGETSGSDSGPFHPFLYSA